MNCYYCDRGEKQHLDVTKHAGVPMCHGRSDACMDRYVHGKPAEPAPGPAKKSKAQRPTMVYLSGSRGTLYLDVWRQGGCIFCGKTPRPTGNKMSHGECFRSASDSVRHDAERYIKEDAEYES